ncbi:MAG: hypothetical protein EHM31_00125 [Candidatus Aminicenantes bacterium]|nr:MAG: hypothetical protein EHM31_00125 [Candidatus Aminicenantes bacterium]
MVRKLTLSVDQFSRIRSPEIQVAVAVLADEVESVNTGEAKPREAVLDGFRFRGQHGEFFVVVDEYFLVLSPMVPGESVPHHPVVDQEGQV